MTGWTRRHGVHWGHGRGGGVRGSVHGARTEWVFIMYPGRHAMRARVARVVTSRTGGHAGLGRLTRVRRVSLGMIGMRRHAWVGGVTGMR